MVIAVMLLRRGSQSVLDKNIKEFCGKPLWWWQANAMVQSHKIDRIWLSTNYTELELGFNRLDIAPIVESGIIRIFQRSEKYATSEATSEDALLECLESIPSPLSNSDLVILAQATTPFVSSKDYRDAIDTMQDPKNTSMLSVSKTNRFYWAPTYNGYGTPINYDPANRMLRQNIEKEEVYVENGGFYIVQAGYLFKHKVRITRHPVLYRMPEWTLVEIDEEDDWVMAEYLMKKHVLINS